MSRSIAALLLGALIYALLSPDSAAAAPDQRMTLRLGANLSRLVTDSNPIPGARAGFDIEFLLHDRTTISTQFLFVLMGGTTTETSRNATLETRRRLLGLNIPIALRRRFGAGKNRFYGTAGPEITFLLSGTDKYTLRTTDEVLRRERSVEGLEGIVLGFGVGCGAERNVSRLVLSAEIGASISDFPRSNKDTLEQDTIRGHFTLGIAIRDLSPWNEDEDVYDRP